MGGEVHNRIHARERGPQNRFIGNIASYQFEAMREATKTGGQIVINHDLVIGTPEGAGDMAADIARSSHNQNRHKTSLGVD
jgi:hypothetical protein